MATPVCTTCQTRAPALQCGACKTPYCGVACQRSDWEARHRLQCAPVSFPIDTPSRRYYVDAFTIASGKVLPEAWQAPKPTENQDVFVVRESKGTLFIGVFDGHGQEGQVAAQAARVGYLEAFATLASHEGVNWTDWMRDTTAAVQASLLGLPALRLAESGTTATLAVLHNGRLHSGSVGDSGLLLLDPEGHVLFESPRLRSKMVIEYSVPTQDKRYRTFLPDALGHVHASAFFRNEGQAYMQGTFVANTPRTLDPDFRLLLATDGFFDIFEKVKQEKREEVYSFLLADDSETPARAFVRAARDGWRDLMAEMDQRGDDRSSDQRDDITVVFVRPRTVDTDDGIVFD